MNDVQSRFKGNKIWEGALVLTAAALITKLLSAGYRIPYQNIVGDIGFYIYQQIYPLYGIALILSTYGFPVIISKLLARHKDEEHGSANIVKIIATSLTTLFIFGMIIFAFLYVNASNIATFMGDEKLSILIKVISFSFLLLPFISVFRGYYQGENDMVPTAVSQVFEQGIRVITIILFAYFLLKHGYSHYEAGAGAIFGSITGGFGALFVLLFFYSRGKRVNLAARGSSISAFYIVKTVIIHGGTICISNLLLILIQFVDAFSLYSLLQANGMDEQLAKISKGIYDRGQPLIQLGTVVATSISLSLVPHLSNPEVQKNRKELQEKLNLILRISIVVGLGASCGLAVIIEPTNIMLFQDERGSTILMILAFSILFTSITLTLASFLQGFGNMHIPAIIIMVGVLVKWGLNYLLVKDLHTLGAAISTVAALLVIMLLHIAALRIKTLQSIIQIHMILKLICSASMMVVIILIYRLALHALFPAYVGTRIFATIEALSAVIVGAIPYLLIVLRLHIFTNEELSNIPLAGKLKVFFPFK